jgi:hypothetical protein
VADLLDRVDRRNGRRLIETLRGVPRPAGVLRLGLQIPPGQIDADGVPEDVTRRVSWRDVSPALADCDHEFYLVLQVVRAWRIRNP